MIQRSKSMQNDE